jgi:hypothetical protein
VPAAGRATRWLLFTVFVSTVPVLYYLGVVERAPTVRLLFLSALCVGVALTEGAVRFQGVFAWLGLGQSLLLLWLAAGGVTRLLGLVRGQAPRRLLLLAVCAGLVAVSLLPIYRTPMSSHAAWSSLRGIFG